MRRLVLEITDKQGVRIEQLSLSENGISIGRAWNSDVIIQDRLVDPDHLRLSINAEKTIIIDDVGSTNGSRLDGKALNGSSRVYQLGDEVAIGDTRIRVFDVNATVLPAALRSSWFLFAEKFSSIRALLVLTMLAMLTQAAQVYSRSIEPLKFENLALASFSVVMLLLLWSLVLGFVAKLFRGNNNVKALWALGCIAALVVNLVGLLLLLIRFNLQNVGIGQALSILIYGVVSIWLLVGVFSYTTHMQNRNKWLSSLLIAISLYSITESEEYLKEPHQKWKSSTNTEQVTLPPAFLIRRGVSIDEYLMTVDSLYIDHKVP